mgnify:CR=1 FL=1
MKGVLGGAFDPPHLGHIVLAVDAREYLNLTEIFFIPLYLPPHKSPPVASFEDRLRMTEIAASPYPFIKVLDIEGKRKGTSYTVDTLRELKKKENKLVLLIGADQAESFSTWKEPHEIVKLARVCVFAREGFKPDKNFPFKILPSRRIDISSTEIRDRIKNKKEVRHLLPPGVWEYIQERNLYR